ncbi:hypothetical protein [Streptomyces sp. NPDC057617]|uniref:hypothetical protein n=1 Tax=Streptomyces sp. NPDC057617 TaxID=3346184 RepID=UPI00367A9CD3
MNVIPHLRRGDTALSALTYLYDQAAQETGVRPRLIDGDCHGAPMDMDDVAGLATAVQVRHGREDAQPAFDRPIMLCTIRSSPDLPSPNDEEWAMFSRRVLSAASLLGEIDGQGCRWLALGTSERQVHLVASLVHDDGRPARSLYNLNMAVWRECQSIDTEYGSRYPDAAVTVRPVNLSPAPSVTVVITGNPTGSVVAEGARDDLSAALLKHAGFQQIQDWYGRRHRLPTTTSEADRASIASHAAAMLRAARYSVELDSALDSGRLTTPTDPYGAYVAGGQILRLTDHIRGAANAAEAAHAVDQLLDPADGVLVRLQEALEAAGEQVTDFDDEAWELADRLTAAAEQLTTVGEELAGTAAEIRILDSPPQWESSDRSRSAARSGVPVAGAARATSPASANVPPSLGTSAPASITPASPAQGPSPRTR